MISELKGDIQLTTVNAEEFIQEVIKLTKEGCEYQPHSGFIRTGLMKKARFKRKAPPVVSFAELPPEYAPEDPQTVVEEVLETNPSNPTTETQEASESPLTDSQEVVVPPPRELPDWDLAKSLRDDSDLKLSKDNLAIYALEFGVTIKKNVTFEKMLKKFEEAL